MLTELWKTILVTIAHFHSRCALRKIGTLILHPRYLETHPELHNRSSVMGRSLILWMVGIPIPIIILLWFFMR